MALARRQGARCQQPRRSDRSRLDLKGAPLATATEVIVRDKLFIGGEWVKPSGTGTIEVINPTTEEPIGRIPDGTPEDADLAVRAARAGFDAWSRTSPYERTGYCQAIGAKLDERGDEIAALITGELGMPLKLSRMIQAGLPSVTFSSMPQLVEEIAWEEEVGNSLIVREPVGVLAAITPWNYPLHQIANKVAPAITAGCTVVLKPSEVVPLNAFILAEIVEAVGLPAGVFNLVTGTGPVVGEAIVAHAETDAVSFTGSTRAGRRVAELAAREVKQVSLELGGKSPNVILDDADLQKAVTDGVAKCFLNSGQTCSALTRMLVPHEKLEEVERIAAAVAETAFPPGDPFGEGKSLGPLASETQLERVRGYIEKGVAEGAKLVTGGTEPPQGIERGYFVRPTVFSDVRSEMTIAQEEIFGPVLAIMPYENEEDAIRIANDTIYGLAGGVWSADEERAKRIASRIRTGQVEINGGAFNPLAPFGGYKQSGHGRELGRYGVEEFLVTKSLQL
jgi:aldehyde dehydrogenase (NAD+)